YGPQNYGLGYYQPATCDHSTTPCVFTPKPNFKSLATQYQSVKISDEATLSSFVPDAARVSPPKCPAGFAKLQSIKWDADAVPSDLCPEKVVTFSCPATSAPLPTVTIGGVSSSSTPAPSSKNTAKNTTPTSNSGAESQNPSPSQNSAPRSSVSTTALVIALSTAAAAALFL
ncbi:hypothetical protein PybrP1_003878, partial [[Pythium] brassicae (nom. inval.)]